MEQTIRIGKVSSVDYANGMVKILYEDKGGAVTAALPCLSNGEYRMPDVGAMVLVAHMSNGVENGVCIGTIWNAGNKPPKAGRGIFHKELGEGCGMESASGNITIRAAGEEIDMRTLISMREEIKELKKDVAVLKAGG